MNVSYNVYFMLIFLPSMIKYYGKILFNYLTTYWKITLSTKNLTKQKTRDIL